MRANELKFRPVSLIPPKARLFVLILAVAFAVSVCLVADAQDKTPTGQPAPSAETAPVPSSETAPVPAAQPAPPPAAADANRDTTAASTQADVSETKGAKEFADAGAITEEELRTMLAGKQLFLRGGYLDNNLSYNEHGKLTGHSAQGSYTLSGIEIEKVHLSKHKVELDGARYGLHFLGTMPYEDPTQAVDRVRITPKKKIVKITIDRELVVKLKVPKQAKEKGGQRKTSSNHTPKPLSEPDTTAHVHRPSGTGWTAAIAADAPDAASPDSASSSTPTTPSNDAASAPSKTDEAPGSGADTAQAETTPATNSAAQSSAPSDTDEVKKEIAAAPAEERPADPNSMTTTTSPAHAKQVLLEALGNVFAQPFDARMMDAMPDFWKNYYDAVAAKTDYRPKDPGVLRQSAVDKKAHLASNFEPPSNDYAQDNGVAGMSLYHVVIGADGKPGDIAVARPIGFGLDESAVDQIRKATFEPAMKDGKAVPVMLDLIVQFRIFSKRTAATGPVEAVTEKSAPAPQLPGPYSVERRPASADQATQ